MSKHVESAFPSLGPAGSAFPGGIEGMTARQTHLRAACSLGKWPLALTAFRMRALTDSKLSCQAAVLRGTSRVTFASFHMCRMMTLAS
jgi:hypothetical protein